MLYENIDGKPKKTLVTSIFSFYQNVFYPVHNKFLFLYARQRRDVLLFYHPWRAGVRAGGLVGGVPHSLSGAYLQDYASYGYETSWVDRSHQGGVQYTGTITLTCLIFGF